MKMTTLKSLAIAVGLTSAAFGQSATSPVVGYETVNLEAGQFNFFGLRFAEKIETTGQFETGDATSLVDDEGDFSFVEDGETYIIEFDGGSSIVAEASSFTNNSVSVDGTGFAGVDFTIRRAARLTDVFGENNEAGLQAGTGAGDADVIFLPQEDGTFLQIFRNQGLANPGGGFLVPPSYQTLDNTVVNPALVFTEAILVQTQDGSSPSFTVSGALITSPQAFSVNGGGTFSFVSSIYPVGTTFGNSGLEANLQAGTGADDADVVFLPRAGGTFEQFFFNQGLANPGGGFLVDPGWQTLGNVDASDVPLTSAILILRNGDPTVGTIEPSEVITATIPN